MSGYPGNYYNSQYPPPQQQQHNQYPHPPPHQGLPGPYQQPPPQLYHYPQQPQQPQQQPQQHQTYYPPQPQQPPPFYQHPTGGPSHYPQQAHQYPSHHPNPHQNHPPPPPQEAQSFGQGLGNHYTFQYSQCTGRKKALLIGINYFGQKGQLRGCINDVKNMSQFLMERFGYKRDDMVILTDDQQHPKSQPTKANILQAMHWLVKDARPNDSLFFHYSGHGGQTKDLDGDEGDGYDETIYPMDWRYNGHIVDDEMHGIMVQPLPAGVRLTAIFDSCHSGSALDLPYLYSTQGILKEPNLFRESADGLLSAIASYSKGDFGGVISSGISILKRATTGVKAEEQAKRTKTSAADVIQWSGSKDQQTSADTNEGGEATGAMSWAFISSLKKNPMQSYQQLLQNIRTELSKNYSQKPQLSCSHPLGMEDPYYFGDPSMEQE